LKTDKTQYDLRWTDQVRKDAKKAGLSNDAQAQIQVQIENLRGWADPEIRKLMDIKQLKGPYRRLFEVRLKGGTLGRANIRVFFAVFTKARLVVVLGLIKKETERGLDYVYETMLDRLENVAREIETAKPEQKAREAKQ
jgi:mRNA-degrading endonuclease RelE of RelBE toxin-antitoxin system